MNVKTAVSFQAGPAPIALSQRILAIDVLRGFALLGILIMNIQAFSMPWAAYFNPTVYGDLMAANLWAWFLSYVFADQKFMTLFSLLFGAGIILLTTRLEQRGQSAWKIYYRRNLWLFLFGLVHAYLFWYGDILVLYAFCAAVVFWLRRLSPRWLVAGGLLSLAVPSTLIWFAGITIEAWPPEVYAEMLASWQPPAPVIQHELAAYRSGWLAQMEVRVPQAVEMQTYALFFWGFWRAGGLMLIGMALYKWGVVTAKRRPRFYATLAVLGLIIGLSATTFGAQQNLAHDWAIAFSRFGPGYQFNYWASLLVSGGYIGLVMLWVQWGGLARLQAALAAVGRMALSNYLLHTFIATTIFYGHGFGLFGSVDRSGQVIIVLAIWVFQLVWSPIWLHYFNFGPAEWLWRSLTYWKRQPMSRWKETAVAAA